MTHCRELLTHFRRDIDFSVKPIASDGGGLLLREVEKRLRSIDSIANRFRDFRVPDRIEFSVRELLTQQIMGFAVG